ncbi:HupE/UreJ family protein [uncultured Bartonella sp.]|uniref:HupE/UreJ family protein n=1 Tax=uncultured Bartonella sp. TaxID=104108 RepID=UPI0025DBB896|nr:HupE/UreJ family protein [uncultured Bartonella sp.]
MRNRATIIVTAGLSVLLTTPAFAHITGVPHDHSSFMGGFLHPFTGFDHILVMVAVGLWAAQLGGKALFAVPLSFVLSMAIGFMLAINGFHLPFVEPVILASVVAIGLFAAMAIHLPLMPAIFVVGAFALFHGFAHGSELGNAEAYAYGFGFSLATALLHATGIAIGLGAGRFFGQTNGLKATRLGGILTVISGIYLAFGA